MKKIKFASSEDIYFIVIFFVNLVFLLYGISNLSISFYEAEIFFNKNDLAGLIANFSCKFFGQNDYALRLPFVAIHFMNLILMYKLSKQILKRRADRMACVILYALLPGIIASAILVNLSGIIIFFTLLFIYLYEIKKLKFALFVLFTTIFIDKSFIVLYISVFCYFSYIKDSKSSIVPFLLFILSILFYDYDIGGRPRGFLIDTIGIYSTVFSPFLFLFFVYSMYRIWVKEEKTLLWFVVMISFCISLVLSLRQRLELDEFLPFVVIAIPLLVRVFYASYRVRLPKFRKEHKNIAIFIILTIVLNSSFLIFNQILYKNLYKNEPQRHFIYKYDIAKELSYNLKNLDINKINIIDKRLALRLKFYNIEDDLTNKLILTDKKDIKSYEYELKIDKFSNIIAKFYIFMVE